MDLVGSHVTRRAFLGGAVVFGAASMLTPQNAFADRTSEDVQAEADAARVKLDNMQQDLEQASINYYNALDEYEAACTKRNEAEARIAENDARIAELQGQLNVRVRSMYRTGSSSALDMLLGATSFESFVQNWDFLQMMNQKDADLVEETKQLRADNEAQRDEYDRQAKIAEEKLAEAEAIKAEAETLVVQYQAEVDALDAEVAELVEKERQAAAEQRAREERERVEREERERQQNTSSGTSSNSGGGTSDNSGGNNSNSGYGGTPPPPSGSVVDYAVSQLGVPYVWGGSTPNQGLDCSGLTSYCWKAATGIWIGRNTEAQLASASWVGPVSEAQPGDVLYTYGHVGICTAAGGGTYIHAPQPGQVVCYSSWSQFVHALRW